MEGRGAQLGLGNLWRAKAFIFSGLGGWGGATWGAVRTEGAVRGIEDRTRAGSLAELSDAYRFALNNVRDRIIT